ncbi:MAG: transposase [Gemmatimonadetes bacterium]|nr:transposase [Gemmatimonadota bacterium]
MEHQGVTAKEVIRRHGIALDTFYRWKRQYDQAEPWRREPPAQAHGGDPLTLERVVTRLSGGQSSPRPVAAGLLRAPAATSASTARCCIPVGGAHALPG